MVFLTPILLVGLLAGLVPIAIHLIRREKPPKLLFSTIRFLKKTSKKPVLFQHLQQIGIIFFAQNTTIDLKATLYNHSITISLLIEPILYNSDMD
jgi:hypothetical protein